MPANSHLRWIELADFTPGLWDYVETLAHRLTMPPNALQELVDAVPQKAGGVRAFYRSSATLSNTGINDPTDEVVTALFARGGLPLRDGSNGDGADRYLLTHDDSDFKPRLYRMDGSNNETTWKQETSPGNYTLGAGTDSCREGQFDFMHTTAGVDYVLLVVRDGLSAAGLYTIRYDSGPLPIATDGDLVKIASYSGPMVLNQARVLIGGGNDEVVNYSSPGSPTPTAGSVEIEPNTNLPNLTSIVPFAPDDLLVAKESGQWVQVQGAIDSANLLVREMGNSYSGRFTEQQPTRTPDGVAFIEPGGNVYLTDGRTFTNISDMIRPFYKVHQSSGVDVVSVGKGAWLGGYLFMPKGYVRDWATGAWFKLSSADMAYWHADPYTGEVLGATQGKSFSIKQWKVFEGQGDQRVSSYYLRTAPFEDPSGRQVEIREVHVYVACYTASTVSVTVDGVTRTSESLAAGRHHVKFPFLARGETLDIKVQCDATNGTSEAPTLERMRVGVGQGHMLP